MNDMVIGATDQTGTGAESTPAINDTNTEA